MKLILMGNAGAGKSTLARRLQASHPAVCLSLDELAFERGTTKRRPVESSLAEIRRFLAEHKHWIVEGCYGDLIAPILPHCDELIFLNPGVEICVAHCRQRPWEPGKFPSKEDQDQALNPLLAWV